MQPNSALSRPGGAQFPPARGSGENSWLAEASNKIPRAAFAPVGQVSNSEIIRVLIDYLLQKGASKNNIIIGEHTQYGEFDTAIKKTGFQKISKDYGITLIDLSKTEFTKKESGGFKFEISNEILKSDLLINVPILKTHLLLGISGALENMTRVISESNYKEFEKDPTKALEAISHLHKVISY